MELNIKTCLNCRFGCNNNICPNMCKCKPSVNKHTGECVPSYWQPMTEAQKFEAEFSKSGKLKGDMLTGYYYDTDTAKKTWDASPECLDFSGCTKGDEFKYKNEVMGNWNIFEIMDRLHDLDVFCKSNDISWDVTIGGAICPPGCARLTFTNKPNNLKRSFTFEIDTPSDTLRRFEISIIKCLSKDFKLKEENKMTTNYSTYFNRELLLKDFREKTLKIKDVKFSGPCTIVLWSDGDKTIVRCGDDDAFDKEKGLAMAIAKKFLGTNKSKSNYCDIFKKFIPDEEKNKVTKKIHTFTVKQYAEKLGYSESKVRKMCREGKLNAIKPNGENWLILL